MVAPEPGVPAMKSRVFSLLSLLVASALPLQSAFAQEKVLRSEEHTSELQSHRDLHSFPTRRSSDLRTGGACHEEPCFQPFVVAGCVRAAASIRLRPGKGP